MRRYIAATMIALAFAISALAQDEVLYPGPSQIPEWAKQGKFRFARLDGGPIEVLKTARSSWGRLFTEKERGVLGNLYTKHSDRMISRLLEANLNWVWITWSVGYSWKDEETQREQCKLMIQKLHAKKMRVTAYLCAVSMFWESMFRDEPRSVRWLAFDPDGVPYRYSGGRDPMRFIADVSNPEWLEYVKRRIAAAIDAGVDAIFLDNTASWSTSEAIENFIAKLRRYVREDRRSGVLFLTNYGLKPERAVLNRNMEVVFAEYWREPGVWEDEWDASNIRRFRYVRGIVPEWKPMISEYSNFHSGNRSTGFLSPRSVKLAIAEAASFRSGYAWDMEGPFDERLMSGDPLALETWKAIGAYNGFLRDHEDLYVDARDVTPIAVLLSPKLRRKSLITFGWEREDSGLFDALSKASILYKILLVSELKEKDLDSCAGVVVPDFVEVPPTVERMLERYKQHGGKVCEASGPDDVAKVRALAPDAVSVSVEGAPHLIANITRRGGNGRLLVHLLNYDFSPATSVRVRVHMGKEPGGQVRLITPDAQTKGLTTVRRTQSTVEVVLDSLETYGVLAID